ncbi:hypothetical protein SSABA_v1c01240 [Spiroplasma sabaudiense Ar-1343]|uniref:Uncharacterized protein n=1 Tax=Spiroplasma sabaudiense Ar-1343 TaxID=1276257 RepID=W6A983_9MOLU|nr:hypothetical protein [Spiroplasma sabaudiense]AHI53536.1 hypothetical protein SSABA_v1c01240 [Spiroplasma sabaudiense Ar-1343]
MFLKKSLNLYFINNRSDWLSYFDETNALKKSRSLIKKTGRKIKNYECFILFKRWILWRWIIQNFTFEERFINNFFKLVKKFDLTLTSQENRFIFNVQEIYFNTWRPIKELPVKFELESKETINFRESLVNVHKYFDNDKKPKIEFENNYDLYFSFKNIYFCNGVQTVLKKINLSDLSDVELKRFGVIITVKKDKYLLRGANKLLVYSILQRVLPQPIKPLKNYEDLYGYFDFLSKIEQKFS